MTDHRGHCFYCERPFSPKLAPDPRAKTIDHVYPNGAALPDKMITTARLLGIAPRELRDNKVNACFECNGRKGQMRPVRWLTLIPSERGAMALFGLLLVLGESRRRVENAFALRSSQHGVSVQDRNHD